MNQPAAFVRRISLSTLLLQLREKLVVLKEAGLVLKDTPLAFRKDDLDEFFESPVSLMPEHLVAQLKNRQEFNDLMRYVLKIRKR